MVATPKVACCKFKYLPMKRNAVMQELLRVDLAHSREGFRVQVGAGPVF